MAASGTTRYGNGAGKGDGWGGPAKGAGVDVKAPKFEPGNHAALGHGPRDKLREERLDLAHTMLINLAAKAEREETRTTALVAFITKNESAPVARTMNINAEVPLVQIFLPENGRDDPSAAAGGAAIVPV